MQSTNTDNNKMAAMKTNGSTRKTNLFSHIRYEHMVAGFSGGVTSTLILHPLDLIKIRFAGMYNLEMFSFQWKMVRSR